MLIALGRAESPFADSNAAPDRSSLFLELTSNAGDAKPRSPEEPDWEVA
jgi:hypothetical protein